MKRIVLAVFLATLFFTSFVISGTVFAVGSGELSITEATERLPEVVSCPPDLDVNQPAREVMQIIDDVYHLWKEYDLDEGESFCIVLEKPEQRRLSAQEANQLLEKSKQWMRPASLSDKGYSLEQDDPRLSGSPLPSHLHNTVLPQDLESLGVIGEDNRVRLALDTMRTIPFRNIGYISMVFPGTPWYQSHRGTGFLVAPYTVLTNAHNVYNQERGGYIDSLEFAPGQYHISGGPFERTRRPFGSINAVNWEAEPEYINNWAEERSRLHHGFDYAAVFINKRFRDHHPTYMPLVFNVSPTEIITSGYPSVAQGEDTTSQWEAKGEVLEVLPRLIEHNADATRGQSGSPIWEDLGGGSIRVIALVSGKGDGFNVGPRLVSSNRSLIGNWMQWRPLTSPKHLEEVSDSLIPFRWEEVAGADRYQLQIRTTEDNKIYRNPIVGNQTQRFIGGFPQDGTEYRWRVRAGYPSWHPWNWSEWSDYIRFTSAKTVPDSPTITYPSHFARLDDENIAFRWSPVEGAKSYQLQIRHVSDHSLYRNPTIQGGENTQRFIHNFPLDGTEYRWRVRAGNDAGWGDWSGYRRFRSIPATTLGTPDLLNPRPFSYQSNSSIPFRWSWVRGATRYQLQIRDASDHSLYRNPIVLGGDSTQRFIHNFPLDGTDYRWRVRAGNGNGWGEWSGYNRFVTMDTRPARGGIRVELRWTKPPSSNVDLDLHFIRPGGSMWRIPDDCYFGNMNPTWGTNPGNNPTLDRDDLVGPGPETITLPAPPYSGAYRVVVHHYSGATPTTATVRIWLRDRLVHTSSRQMTERRQVWHVANINWPAATVTPVNTILDTALLNEEERIEKEN